MEKKQPMRRLAAIVVGDVVGYSRMMQADESRTLAALRAMMSDVVEPSTEEFRGRIVKRLGDGWLTEFRSVSDALLSSLEIQRSMARRSAQTVPEGQLELRIGINLGEIVFEGDDIFGTGVNVAARLQSIAKPGGICISESVYQQIQGILDLRYEDMGLQRVKNVQPVHTFAVYANDPAAPGTWSPRSADGGPSIAVLPFDDLSSGASQAHFVDGMVDGLITALSRFKWLTVIARNSTFAYRDRAEDIRRVAQELGARYVLEGSVRVAGERIRVNGQLIDATTGGHLWADRFDGTSDDVFDLEDRMTESVVATLEPQIRRAEIERVRRKRPGNLDAYELFIQAVPHVYAMRPDDNAKALGYLEEAMRLDPGFAPPRAFAAWCLEERLSRRWPQAGSDDAERAVRLAREALDADTDDAAVIATAGFVLVMVGRSFDRGLGALRRAVDLNPNNAFVLMLAGWAEAFAGGLADAQEHLQRARALNPRDPAAFYVLTGLAMVHLLSGDYETSAQLAAASVAVYDQWDSTYFVQALALAGCGRIDEAKDAVSRLTEFDPSASIAQMREMVPIRDPERLARLEQDMRMAGLPETPPAA